MNTILELSGQAWSWLARASWQAAVLVVVVLAVQGVLGRRLAPQWRCALWWLVVLRLVLPVWPGSALSLFNWIGGPSRAPRSTGSASFGVVGPRRRPVAGARGRGRPPRDNPGSGSGARTAAPRASAGVAWYLAGRRRAPERAGSL